eukprot:1158679-Pelagomonas_calceolata.AAC.1
MHPTPPNITQAVMKEACNIPSQLANKEICNFFWSISSNHPYTSKLKYRTGTIYTLKHAIRFKSSSTSARCPLVGHLRLIAYWHGCSQQHDTPGIGPARHAQHQSRPDIVFVQEKGSPGIQEHG